MRPKFLKGVALMGLAAISLSLNSCKEENNNYTVPTTYNFENVSYDGQTTRIAMLEELGNYAKSANTVNATALDATLMKNMFANTNDPFADASLNSADKQLKDKTVSSETAMFEEVIDSLAAASAATSNTNPSNGVAGIVQNNDGTKSYLVNANGFELAQMLEKGLMGACFYYQATAVYLGSGKMDVDNETVVAGEGTAMEHHWDEAFGYLGVPVDFPLNTNDLKFWGKYTNGRNSTLGNASTLMNALLAGRAAISANDLATRDVKITEVRRQWELVCAATAVHYLNSANDAFSTDAAVKHHALSEAYAFIYSLKWGGDATISASEVDAILTSLAGSTNPLEANLFNTTTTDIANVKAALVSAFSSLDAIKDDL
jgi:hypothetical protein